MTPQANCRCRAIGMEGQEGVMRKQNQRSACDTEWVLITLKHRFTVVLDLITAFGLNGTVFRWFRLTLEVYLQDCNCLNILVTPSTRFLSEVSDCLCQLKGIHENSS